MLHVPNERIVPIDDVKRTIRRKFQVRGSIVAVIRNNEIVTMLAGEPRAFLTDRVLLCPKKPNRIVEEVVSLHRVREVTTTNKFPTRSRAHLVCRKLSRLPNLIAVRNIGTQR